MLSSFRISYTMASSGFKVSALVGTGTGRVKKVIDDVLAGPSDSTKQTSDRKYRRAFKAYKNGRRCLTIRYDGQTDDSKGNT